MPLFFFIKILLEKIDFSADPDYMEPGLNPWSFLQIWHWK